MSKNNGKWITSPQARSYIYRIAIAVLTLLVAIGVISDNLVAPISGLIAAILALSLADANVPEDNKNYNNNVKEDEDSFSENENTYIPKHSFTSDVFVECPECERLSYKNNINDNGRCSECG